MHDPLHCRTADAEHTIPGAISLGKCAFYSIRLVNMLSKTVRHAQYPYQKLLMCYGKLTNTGWSISPCISPTTRFMHSAIVVPAAAMTSNS